MVSPLLVLLALAAVQIILVALVRMSVSTIALESARVGAAWDADVSDAEDHARALLRDQLRAGTVKALQAQHVQVRGMRMMQVHIVINPMAIGPLPANELSISAHAIEESQ